jgi:pimeloyl-ACP methyl ester carboxylesterase
MGIERAHILGMSWGGVLAQEFYRLHATRIGSLVLAGTYAGWRGSLPPVTCSERLATCMRAASLPAEEFAPQWIPGLISAAASQNVRDELSLVVSDFHPVGFRLMAQSLHDTDTTDLLPQIRVPTLLLWGDADRRSPLSIAETAPGSNSCVRVDRDPDRGACRKHGAAGRVQCPGSALLFSARLNGLSIYVNRPSTSPQTRAVDGAPDAAGDCVSCPTSYTIS